MEQNLSPPSKRVVNDSDFSITIDSGGKEETFDEIFTFTHVVKKLRNFEIISKTKKEEIPFLLDNEFILNVNVNYEGDEFLQKANHETLSLLKTKTKTYLTSDDYTFKSNYFDVVFNFVNDIGFENSVNLFLPIIMKMPIEVFQVKFKFLQNINKYTLFLNTAGEEGYKIIKNHIIPTIFELIQDKKSQKISDLACDVLIDNTRYLNEEDRGSSVLSTVLTLANDDQDEESRILASKLFNNLASFIGHELCEFYIIPQVASFSHDTNSKVRKAVASGFHILSSNVNRNMFKAKLIPVFQKLSQDSLWTVRKALAEQIHKISTLCEEDVKQTVLIDIFKKFSLDSQRYVKIVVVENFGYFIDTMERHKINKSLIDFYIQLVSEFYNSSQKKVYSPDADMIYFCAYNFPAVLICYGPEHWSELRGIYISMANDREKKVKKSIASSIAEVANLLDTSIVEKDILPIFEKFFREESEIQLTVLKNMPKFLKKLQPSSRNVYLDKIIKLPNPRDKWRTRAEKAKSISKYSSVFEDEITYKHLLPICLQYCVDDIAEVRNVGARYLSLIFLQLLIDGSTYQSSIQKIIEAFSTSIHYNYRQIFTLMAYKMGRNEQLFIKYFWSPLRLLCFDKVPNVRISLATTLKEMLDKYPWCQNNEEFQRLLYTLKRDENHEPKRILESVTPKGDFKIETTQNTNHLFDNRMTFLKDEFSIIKNLPLNSKFVKKTQLVAEELEESKIILTAQTSSVKQETNTLAETTTNLVSEEKQDSRGEGKEEEHNAEELKP